MEASVAPRGWRLLPRGQVALSARRRRAAWAIVVAGLPVLTLGGVAYRGYESLTAVILAYVLVVVGVAVLGGIAPAVTGAFASFLLANFFLTQPYYTFQIGSREHIVELVLFVVVGVIVSVTVEVGARDRAVQGAHARELAEIDRIRSAILAAVSHDLRTPLSSIKVAVSTLRQPDIAHLRTDVPEHLPTVVADPDLLERVIANLVANATRFDPVDAEIQARTSGHRVDIAVVDHGPGVPPDQWAEMFTAFRRLDDREGHTGSGLGLAIARGFCDAMGATLTATRTPGGGLTMTVRLDAT